MLRKLFEKWAAQKHVSQQTYALMKEIVKELEALVEAVEPEDTDATIRKLREERDEAISAGRLWIKEYAKVQAEIQRLRHELSAAADCTHEYRQKIVELEADAELGRLVLGMRDSTRLVRGTLGYYLAMERMESTSGGDLWTWLPGCSTDPAEALRSIQGGGDDEA